MISLSVVETETGFIAEYTKGKYSNNITWVIAC